MSNTASLLRLFPHPPTHSPLDQKYSCQPQAGVQTSVNATIKELFHRAARGVIGSRDKEDLFCYLLSLDEVSLFAFQVESLTELMALTSKSQVGTARPLASPPTYIQVQRYYLDFNNQKCPLQIGKFYTDFIILNPLSGKVYFKVIPPEKSEKFDLFIYPMQGKIKPGKQSGREISVRLYCRGPTEVKCVIEIQICGGFSSFVTIIAQSKLSYFGIPLKKPVNSSSSKEKHCLSWIYDSAHPGFKRYEVPTILVRLKKCLKAENAFHEKYLFCIEGDQEEEKKLRESLEDELNLVQTLPDSIAPLSFIPQNIHVVANLIKRFFSELPERLFSSIPEKLLNGKISQDNCWQILDDFLSSSELNVALWLFDVVTFLILNETSNKIRKQISLNLAPHLFPVQINLNPYLIRRQVLFISKLLQKRAQIHNSRKSSRLVKSLGDIKKTLQDSEESSNDEDTYSATISPLGQRQLSSLLEVDNAGNCESNPLGVDIKENDHHSPVVNAKDDIEYFPRSSVNEVDSVSSNPELASKRRLKGRFLRLRLPKTPFSHPFHSAPVEKKGNVTTQPIITSQPYTRPSQIRPIFKQDPEDEKKNDF